MMGGGTSTRCKYVMNDIRPYLSSDPTALVPRAHVRAIPLH